ncbi:MAG: threonine--tRNA ligase [Mycoplasmatales bacterium]
MITITFPDGNKKEFENNISALQVAKSISSGLAKTTVSAMVNGKLVDVTDAITTDCELRLLTTKDPESFEILNHSTAHLMAQAVKNLFPNAKFGVGPAIEEGFYYDIDANNEIKESDLPLIEKEMNRIVAGAHAFSHKEVSVDEAREIFKDDQYKQYLISKIEDKDEKLTVYSQGNFTDLCRGVHVENTNKIKHFKLLSIAGAYWLGDSDNIMLQRIYGTSWFTKDELDAHLQVLEDRKGRDHRKLGKELGLFAFSQETGQGLPLWLPKGATVRYELERFIKDEEIRRGYQHVYTPVLGTKKLYETSGHWAHYQDDMFAPIEMDNETFVLRPMNCPHHMMVFKNDLHSYKDLPIRIAELGGTHRYEASGALIGLERVRYMTLNDAHIFCTPNQVADEFKQVIELVNYAIEVFDLDLNYMRLSLRDPEDKEKYYDNDEMWNTAEAQLKDMLNQLKVDYIPATGEAAFYGPKLDIQIKTALGHDITLATIQLDFLLPEKFDLTYIGEDGQKHRPIVIHRGVISTMERMMATLIEQYKGAFPLWLAPVQLNVIPVSNNAHLDYAKEIVELFKLEDIRTNLDDREEKLNYKIRESQVSKVPYTLILGDNEVEGKTVTIRKYGETTNTTMSIEEFKTLVLTQRKNRTK